MLHILLLLLSFFSIFVSNSSVLSMKVLVTGAGGKTGSLVLQKLLSRNEFEPIGLVRTKASEKNLRKKLGALGGSASIRIGDVTNTDELKSAMDSVEAVVLCTSAVPKIKYWSLILVLFNPVRKLLGLQPVRPKFSFGGGGIPEKVDYHGAVAQIECAKQVGVKKFVFLSSMGGTQPENFLNSIGRKKDGTGGDILLWKRKAEEHLLESGLDYTILHPGGLLDQPGGKRELMIGLDDAFLASANNRSIPREDVAEVCVQCLTLKEASGRSLDLVSRKEGEGTVTTDFAALLNSVEGSCDYSVQITPLPQ